MKARTDIKRGLAGITLAITALCLATSCEKMEIYDQGGNDNLAALDIDIDWNGYAGTKSQVYLIVARLNDTSHTWFVTDSASLFLYESPYSPAIEGNVTDYKEYEDGQQGGDTPQDDEGDGTGTDSGDDSDGGDDQVVVEEDGTDDGTSGEDGGEGSDGTEGNDGGEGEGTGEEEPAQIGKDAFKLLSGDYSMMVATKDDWTTIDDIVSFVTQQDKVGMQHLRMVYRDITDMAQMPTLGGKPYVDRNPGYRFITNSGPKFVGKVGNASLKNDGGTNTQSFTMQQLTQRVHFTFTFNVTADEGDSIAIDSNNVVAEIAGVIPAIYLVDETMRTNSLKRMFLTGEATRTDSTANKATYRYEGYIDAFGLLAGADNEVVSGPGVLRIGMELSLINADGEKTSKVITATHNICAAINNAGLTEIEDDPEKRVQSTKEASISIGETLDIDATAVMAGDSNGITGWDEAEIEFDI